MFYRADYTYHNPTTDKDEFIDSDYFNADTDSEAIEIGLEADGTDTYFVDLGKVKISLVQICEVDENEECFPDIRTIWY